VRFSTTLMGVLEVPLMDATMNPLTVPLMVNSLFMSLWLGSNPPP